MSDYKNDFDNSNSCFNTVLTDLVKRKKKLRSGEWTTEQENKMLMKFIHERQDSAKNQTNCVLNQDYNIEIIGENTKYIEKDFVELDKNYDDIFIRIVHDLAAIGVKISDTAYLTLCLKALNETIPLKGSLNEWQEQANTRAKIIHNINKTLGVNSYLFLAYNEETEHDSYFILVQGKCRSSTTDLTKDGWQIVNPAAMSIVNIGTYEMLYPNRAFINDNELDIFTNNTPKFTAKYETAANDSEILDILNDDVRAVAVIKNVGNLDFTIKEMKEIKK